MILGGVAVALAPGDHLKIEPRRLWAGVLACAIAALGGALGAVLSRKAYAVAHAAGEHPDPGTTGYQRVLGGAVALGLVFLVVKWRHARRRGDDAQMVDSFSPREKLKLWPWVLANSLAGQTVGVSCMQWALENTPTGIVTAIIAMTPIVMLPLGAHFRRRTNFRARNDRRPHRRRGRGWAWHFGSVTPSFGRKRPNP